MESFWFIFWVFCLCFFFCFSLLLYVYSSYTFSCWTFFSQSKQSLFLLDSKIKLERKTSNTMFGLLDDDDEVGGQDVEVKVEDKKDGNVDLQVTTGLSETGADSAAWTDVSSTKSRRLAPQWASTKQESPAASSTPTDSSKKKGNS